MTAASAHSFRPFRIVLKAVDPFDETLLSIIDMPYNSRLSAKGHYTRVYKRLSKGLQTIHQDILGPRKMRLEVELVPRP
jgi:hypothetical protein